MAFVLILFAIFTSTADSHASGQIARFTPAINSQVTVATVPTLQIISLAATAPNAPRVNTGQPFQLRCGITNISNSAVTNVGLRLKSDGQSSYDSSLIVANLPAHDTTYVVLDVVAAPLSTSGEIFRVDVVEPPDADLPPVDNTALIIISKPPRIVLTPFLSGAAGGIVTTGSEFSLVIDIRNDGEGAIAGTDYELGSNVDLGISNPIRGTLNVGQPLSVTFVAPLSPTALTINFRFLAPPTDINTGLPADLSNGDFTLNLDVASTRNPSLFAAGNEADGNLFTSGKDLLLGSFSLRNDGPVSLGPVSIDTLALHFRDADGTSLNAGVLFAPGSVDVLGESGQIGTGAVYQGKLVLVFDSLWLSPADSTEFKVKVHFNDALPGTFHAYALTSDLKASLTQGAFIGQPVEVSAENGDSIFTERFVQGGDTFEQSLRVRNNPFNPLTEPAEFRFLPPVSGAVKFCIHTLTGELIYERDIDPQQMNDPAAVIVVSWDGRTSAGDVVRNGAYVVSITDESGRQCRLKVAVLK